MLLALIARGTATDRFDERVVDVGFAVAAVFSALAIGMISVRRAERTPAEDGYAG